MMITSLCRAAAHTEKTDARFHQRNAAPATSCNGFRLVNGTLAKMAAVAMSTWAVLGSGSAAGDTPAVMNVTFQQRYPWNGLVDVTCDVTGSGIVKLSATALTNGVVFLANPTIAGETTIDLDAADGVANGVRMVWNAAADLPAGFKADGIQVNVAAETAPPAGQLWKNGPIFAACNVGANKPEEPGCYFWWGDTIGYAYDGSKWVSVDGMETVIKFSDAPANSSQEKDVSTLMSEGWIDAGGNLVADRDAATAHLGTSWRMPTRDEFDALTNTAYCTSVWTDNYNGTGVAGRIVTGATDGYTDRSIFLPASGRGYSANYDRPGTYGVYWSSTPQADSAIGAWYLNIDSATFKNEYGFYRSDGCTVRPVQDAPAAPEVSEVSAEGVLDLTVGDRVAADEEALVIDPAWGEATTATVAIDGEASKRTYASASIDTWETTALEPGRYALALAAGDDNESAAFWKTGADWVVFDSSNITADVTFEADKTYLVLGTNMADGATLTVQDGAKFHYDENAPAGFKAVSVVELPKRYKIADGDDPADESKLFQIVEKIKGCEDNPWDIGEGVTAYTNGTELVIGGEGTIADLSEIPGGVKGDITAVTVADPPVTGAEADAFAGLDDIALTLPDDWQGELPDEDGNWYGAKNVTLTAYPIAVKNVKFQQRWPWNGLVDITCDLTGEGVVTLNVTALTNDAPLCMVTSLMGGTTVDLDAAGGVANGVKLVWNAMADLPENFNAQDVAIEVMADETALTGVQLWAGGPFFAACNVGATKPEEYGDLVKFGNTSQAVTDALGADWRVPTAEDFGGLTNENHCTVSWTDDYNETGVSGCVVASKADSTKSIFLPAAGFNWPTGSSSFGTEGYYWSSTPNDEDPDLAASIKFRVGYFYVTHTQSRSYGMSVRAVRDAPSAKSSKGTVDLRTTVALAEGETTVPGVTWSATAWGALPETFTTVGYMNLTTGATGEFGKLANIMGEGAKDVDLPKKDGDYKLTHSTGDLTSFVTFTVSGYPLGSEANPWEIGAGEDPASVTAVSNGTGTVFFQPARGVVTKAGLETVVNAMGGASFPAKLVSEDGTATNDLVMALGASGTVYDTIAEALAGDEASYTLFEVNGYFVSYNGGEGALGSMATDTFVPSVPTNLTANAYEIIGYKFDGWSVNGTTKAYDDCAAGVDFAQPGETLSLTSLWTQVETKVTTYDDLTNVIAKVTRPVTITLDGDIKFPADGKIQIPTGKDVAFAGEGKFDVAAVNPGLFNGITVGTGLKPEDFSRFVTDEDVKAYYEDGKVVLRGRGESEDFPWLLGDDVTAWAVDGAILAKPARGAVSVASLHSVTNELGGYVPGPGEFKVVSEDGAATNDVVMLLGDDGKVYDTLADVLAASPSPETVQLFEVKQLTLSLEAGAWGGASVDINDGERVVDVPAGTQTNLDVLAGMKVVVTPQPNAGFTTFDKPLAIDSMSAPMALPGFTCVPNPEATLRWKFCRGAGRFFGQIAITAQPGYDEAFQDIAFLFEDRSQEGKTYAQLWDMSARGPVSETLENGGTTYRAATLGASPFADAAAGERVVIGLSDASYGSDPLRTPKGDEALLGLYVLDRVNPVSGNLTAGEPETFLCYLSWVTDGTRYYLPMAEGAACGALSPEKKPVLRAMLSARKLGSAFSLGLPLDAAAENAFESRIISFEVGPEIVSGQVEVSAGEATSTQYINGATVTVFGAESLGGEWKKLAAARVDLSTGRFEIPASAVEGTDAGFFFRAVVAPSSQQIVE